MLAVALSLSQTQRHFRPPLQFAQRACNKYYLPRFRPAAALPTDLGVNLSQPALPRVIWGDMLDSGERYALLLSTLAGLSTSIGGCIAIIRRPGPALLSFLLGLAIGVMLTLSVLEMWLHNAYEHGAIGITAATAAGVALYYYGQPFLPDFEGHKYEQAPAAAATTPSSATSEGSAGQKHQPTANKGHQPAATKVHQFAAKESAVDADSPSARSSSSESPLAPRHSGGQQQQQQQGFSTTLDKAETEARVTQARSAELLRLGLVMGLTMTLHNMPEGFAVAFSSFTTVGPVMALAIAVHNIPEGIIVAAPVFAATGSRWKALGIATASGLSEPFGALIALLVIHPFLTPLRLHLLLGFVGGIMMAVCCVELLPEGRKCRQDLRLVQGVSIGTVLMIATLWAGV